MALHIIVNKIDDPNIIIPLIISETKTDSDEYKSCIDTAQKLVSIMTLILEKSKKDTCKNPTQELR